MPIFEFKCLKCNEVFELLVLSKQEDVELKCPRCDSPDFERVMSTTNYAMGNPGGSRPTVGSQTRTCSSGNCTTWDIPGHSR